VTTLFISHSSKDNAWSERLRDDLRGQGYQSLFLDFHPDDGIPAGAKWEQALHQHLRKCRGVVALCSPHWLASPWCVAEAMMARERGKPVFVLATEEVTAAPPGVDAAAVPRVPDFLKDAQFIRLSGLDPRQVLERLLRGLREAGISDDFPLPARPYPGLEPFTEHDAAVFFGRDGDIARVLERLRQRLKNNARGFIVVLGASGCGKSSLVRAGVLPRLGRTGEALKEWVIAERFTGVEGLDGLARSLATALNKDFSDIRTRIGSPEVIQTRPEIGAGALRAIANDLIVARGLARARVLLVLDQLEEVFGTPEGSDARALLRLLLEAAAGDGSRVVVLATMRSDFLNLFQLFPGARENYEELTLDPMPSERFAEVIEGPARRFGLDLAPGLSERLAADTSFNDALPLLAFALEKLYDRCKASGKLTIDEYESLFPPVTVIEGGKTVDYRGVAASIKHRADDILRQARYAGLSPDAPRLRDLRRAFFALARVGEAGQFTRRIALKSRMPDSCSAVLKRFVEERLLVTGHAEDDAPTLSVAHEALFRVWDQLRNWLHQDRRALALRGQIELEATERKWPWPEDRVIDAVSEIERSGVSLEDVEQPDAVRAFLGPTGLEELAALPALGSEHDAGKGSSRYGKTWQLPLSHEARAKVGVRLALLGDRVHGDGRKGTGLTADGLPEIDWCPVRGGEVTLEIRENTDDANSKVVDEPTREVEDFHIARYPVTIAQFQAFLRACHDGKRWTATFLRDQDYRPPKHRAAYANHPADSVNWYDAMAFCQWLSECLGYEVRLPTEFEWQQAATGGDPNRRYPWGTEEWDPVREPWRANTHDSELGRSTAVGMYPQGASPVGTLDMAGTLYEWCLNAFDDPDNLGWPASTAERRVLRGGSWNYARILCRCASRYGNHPGRRDVSLGFRVCCAPPIA
jgi:formylglycine-generating enzyme required for sulfatase activity